MSLFKQCLICLFLLTLIGCGFRPLHLGSTNRAMESLFLEMEISPIKNRSGQLLRNHLIRHLYRGRKKKEARYRLVTKLSEEKLLFAVKKNAFATRANLELTASFYVARRLDGETIFADSSQITLSYNVLDSEFASHMAEMQARKRGLKALSEEMRTRLTAHFFDQMNNK